MTPTPVIYRADLGPPPPPALPLLAFGDVDWRSSSTGGTDGTGGLMVRATNWLGDGVMTLPAVYQLHRALPVGTPLHILCRANLAAFWQAVPWVNSVVAMPDKRLDAATTARLRALATAATVLLPNSFGTAWELKLAGLPRLIGRRGRGRGLILTHALPAWRRERGKDRWHEARHYLELALACGADPVTAWTTDHPPLAPRLDDAALAMLATALAPLDGGGRRLVIAPGAAFGPAKQWPPAHVAKIVAWWLRHHGPVIAVGTPAEATQAGEILGNRPNTVNLAGKTSLAHLLYLLAQADAVLVNDSGAMHVAGALGKSGVAVFGSTEPVATGPLGGRFAILRLPLPCSPCLQRTCPRRDIPYECLQRITPPMVEDAFGMALSPP